jgi:hypothetical protein
MCMELIGLAGGVRFEELESPDRSASIRAATVGAHLARAGMG